MSEFPAAAQTPPAGTDALAALAVLGDESRRGLLEFVRRAHRPVTREEAAAAVGISRKLAAFHLDKLVTSGLLQARHGGHGPRRVGRAPKVYEPSPHTVTISLPPRRQELLASLLAEAVTAQKPQESAREAALRVARERGEALGGEAHAGDANAVLEALGFEPEDDGGGRTVLHNCPFHPVAAQAPELVCAMNHAFLRGYLSGSGDRETTAVLDPRPGVCCVQLRSGPARSGEAAGPADVSCARDASG
ncbi:transcriptional regulator [Streptomyces sp. Li-HN-5-11]|uniref:helix-turn-helix transcriptional regulator n=1 Tax=Streptomyces sp. Li-HN-5-11 TaxID=3075432 RepID=UPI0028A9B28B|nr:transcriptional regulator [Streptomyces sp. Li-HN-5-11]WNM36626.1 transcriptional regulator [Streptomyces sp. Li-HN-5-11]